MHRGLKDEKSLGVDLEGRLRKGGSINLIQIAASHTIYIVDVFHMEKISEDK